MEQKMISPITYVDDQGNPIVKKTPEEKEYLLLLKYVTDDDMEGTEFCIFIGRTEARKYIIDVVPDLDIFESYVLVEGVKLENRITVYEFMKHMENYFTDGFDIEDYNIGASEEEIQKAEVEYNTSVESYDSMVSAMLLNNAESEDI